MKKKLTSVSILLLLMVGCTPTKDMAPGAPEDEQPTEIVEIDVVDNDLVINEEPIGDNAMQSEIDLMIASLPSPEDLPLDTDYIEINDNIPMFTNEDLEVSEPYHDYAALDHLDRVGTANALLDVDLMPAEERGSISHIKPTGWKQEKYNVVSGGWLYNRSHLIGHQMTGYDGADNLMTGTRQFNVVGMLPFENFIADTVAQQEMQVRYRVRPIYKNDNLLSHGITMEGFSIDDNGETLSFNVFVPNQQDGITLNYQTGDSRVN